MLSEKGLFLKMGFFNQERVRNNFFLILKKPQFYKFVDCETENFYKTVSFFCFRVFLFLSVFYHPMQF